jgi:hypothetical protein
MDKLPSESIRQSLKTIADFIAIEDRAVRERQIRTARQLKFYWDGLTNIWWSDVAHDWRVWNQQANDQSYGDAAYYDKKINVFKAYLESIIAALSTSIPPVRCIPDDAESAIDCSTAKAGDNIAELLYRHNNSELLWARALFLYCTEGMVAAYNYVEENEKYGTYDEPQYEDSIEQSYICPECGMSLPDDIFQQSQQLGQLETDEFDPGDDDILIKNALGDNLALCPSCIAQLDPSLQKSPLVVTRVIGNTTKAKSRVHIEAYGLLSVKVPNYARKQSECPYLVYSYETNFANARARYEHLSSKIFDGKKIEPGRGGVWDPYEAWGRTSTQYLGEYPINTVTCRNLWLRPESYYILSDSQKVNELKKAYPDGCKVVFVNEDFAEAHNESLDDHWTLTYNPLSDHVNFNALGLLLTSVQDITNELISLVLQTIEHGIPQTFVDPGVLNLDQYRQVEVAPGMIYPATPKAGKSLGDAFYEIKTATLSQETLPFGEQIQQLGQLASGALPALFGGAQPNSSKTAAQYLTSKNQAMQRLQTPWKMICSWWKEIYGKAIPMYIKEIVEDERYVTKNDAGNYINVFIRKSELEGKIGNYELEAAENLPLSWMQKKDTIMQFLQAANPVVMQALIAPENLPILADVVGLNNITLPGANDRQVQLEEIVQLVNTTPIEDMGMDPMSGMPMPQQQPSVTIEPDVDNHEVHIEMCKNWLTSEAGRLAKVENNEGYLNVLLHMKQHVQYIQQLQMQQAMMQGGMPEEGAEGKPANDKVMAPAQDKAHEVTA